MTRRASATLTTVLATASTQRTIRSVLIANRGEIAVRIAQTCQQRGIRVIALASDLEPEPLVARYAQHVVHLHGTTLADTYLNAATVLAAAKDVHADAIHPGYGFLSENAAFAQACTDAGIVFIGPTPSAITAMGDKVQSKQAMRTAGVPVVPGFEPQQGVEIALATWQAEAHKIGYPVLVKASAGGGGKGMRLVETPEGLAQGLESAQREARNAFGNDHVFLEKYVQNPRHIEFQVLGDAYGQVHHVFERECSIQRRHQKIIEESPSPFLTPALRNAMGEAAVKAASAIGYQNAGTVEFIVGDDGGFYFLEMNTRLQVEHPITECVSGEDLVAWQLRLAQGEVLPAESPFTQRGWAIECRVYAEDPDAQFMPSTGKLTAFAFPQGPGIRVDTGVMAGDTVTASFDPMLAKVITTGATRAEALARMVWALQQSRVAGVRHNIPYLLRILAHPAFVAGTVTTHFIAEHAAALQQSSVVPTTPLATTLLAGAAQAVRLFHPTSAGAVSVPSFGQLPDALALWRQPLRL